MPLSRSERRREYRFLLEARDGYLARSCLGSARDTKKEGVGLALQSLVASDRRAGRTVFPRSVSRSHPRAPSAQPKSRRANQPPVPMPVRCPVSNHRQPPGMAHLNRSPNVSTTMLTPDSRGRKEEAVPSGPISPAGCQCCFCGRRIEKEEEAVDLVIGYADESVQQVWAHAACLKSKLHPSVPLPL